MSTLVCYAQYHGELSLLHDCCVSRLQWCDCWNWCCLLRLFYFPLNRVYVSILLFLTCKFRQLNLKFVQNPSLNSYNTKERKKSCFHYIPRIFNIFISFNKIAYIWYTGLSTYNYWNSDLFKQFSFFHFWCWHHILFLCVHINAANVQINARKNIDLNIGIQKKSCLSSSINIRLIFASVWRHQ